MKHELMLKAAQKALASMESAQSNLSLMVDQLKDDRPDFFQVTGAMMLSASGFQRGFESLRRTGELYEALMADWRENGEPEG